MSGAGGLASTPVMDAGGYNEAGAYHYQWFHCALRDRMAQANGNADNHIMWRGNPVPPATAWNDFIQWVTAYKTDTGSGSQRDKVIRDRPAAVVDGCWSDANTFIASMPAIPPF